MSKFNREINKQIKKLNDDFIAKYKKLFKEKGVIEIEWRWNKPSDQWFKKYGSNAKAYINSLYTCKTPTKDWIANMFEYGGTSVFVTKDELKHFETVTFPKLYAKWLAKQKQLKKEEHAKNAKDPEKIRAKIEKLQRQLDELK